jgi:DNA-binding response OmpR family regulator
MLRILIIEDETALAHSMQSSLQAYGYTVEYAPDGERGYDLLETHDYDLVLLDIRLPRRDGWSLCRHIRTHFPHVYLVILTACTSIEERVKGLDLGAADYLTKPFALPEVHARIRALLRRDHHSRDTILEYRDLRVDPVSHCAWRGNRRLDLTRKEFGILHYLLHRRGCVVSQEELLDHLWDREANPFSATVRVHVNTLRRKLEAPGPTPPYIDTVAGVGYRIGEELRP